MYAPGSKSLKVVQPAGEEEQEKASLGSKRALERGQPGELLIRGHCVFLGYWADDQATREVLGPDGWYHTGYCSRKI